MLPSVNEVSFTKHTLLEKSRAWPLGNGTPVEVKTARRLVGTSVKLPIYFNVGVLATWL